MKEGTTAIIIGVVLLGFLLIYHMFTTEQANQTAEILNTSPSSSAASTALEIGAISTAATGVASELDNIFND